MTRCAAKPGSSLRNVTRSIRVGKFLRGVAIDSRQAVRDGVNFRSTYSSPATHAPWRFSHAGLNRKKWTSQSAERKRPGSPLGAPQIPGYTLSLSELISRYSRSQSSLETGDAGSGYRLIETSMEKRLLNRGGDGKSECPALKENVLCYTFCYTWTLFCGGLHQSCFPDVSG